METRTCWRTQRYIKGIDENLLWLNGKNSDRRCEIRIERGDQQSTAGISAGASIVLHVQYVNNSQKVYIAA